MFNLLPDNIKQKIKSEYRLRLLSVVLVSVLFLQVVSLFLLLPSWVLSLYKEKEAVAQKNFLDKSLLTLDTKSTSSVITDLNTKLNALSSSLSYPKILPLVNSIIANKSGEIRIKELSFDYTSENTANVVVKGVSSNRDSLVAFVKKIQDSNIFKNVNLPISNLAKDKNIDFSINMTVSP
ncbi:MAG TPA: PilN domain-containing protein [Candidatus Paceibacterota bacterium]